ncbi:hypothetical protein D3C85_1734070 [compost metagenome]
MRGWNQPGRLLVANSYPDRTLVTGVILLNEHGQTVKHVFMRFGEELALVAQGR